VFLPNCVPGASIGSLRVGLQAGHAVVAAVLVDLLLPAEPCKHPGEGRTARWRFGHWNGQLYLPQIFDALASEVPMESSSGAVGVLLDFPRDGVEYRGDSVSEPRATTLFFFAFERLGKHSTDGTSIRIQPAISPALPPAAWCRRGSAGQGLR
jgi:hypothetical protein